MNTNNQSSFSRDPEHTNPASDSTRDFETPHAPTGENSEERDNRESDEHFEPETEYPQENQARNKQPYIGDPNKNSDQPRDFSGEVQLDDEEENEEDVDDQDEDEQDDDADKGI